MAFNHPSRLRSCECGHVPAPALIIPIPNGGFAAPTWYIKLACTIQPYGVAQQVPEIEFKNPALAGPWYGRPPLSGLQPNQAFDIPWGEDETRSVTASMTVNNRNPDGVVLELRDAESPETIVWQAVNMTYFDGNGSCQMVCTIGDKSGGIKWLPYPCLRIPHFDSIANCLCDGGILLGARVRLRFDPESIFSELDDRSLFLEPTGNLNILAGIADGGSGVLGGGSGTCIATEVTATTTLEACEGPARFIVWGEWMGSVAATGSYDSNQWFKIGVAYVCKQAGQQTMAAVAVLAFNLGSGPDLSGAGKPCPSSGYMFDLSSVPAHPLTPAFRRNDQIVATSDIDRFTIEFAQLGGRINPPCNSVCPGPSEWEIAPLSEGNYRLPQWRKISSACSGECFNYNCNARPPFTFENKWLTVAEFEELGYHEPITYPGTCECAPEFVNPPAPPVPCDARKPNLTIARQLCDEVGPGLYLYRWAPITNPCGGSVSCGSNPPCTWIPPFPLPSYPIGDSEAEDWDGRDLPSLVGEEFEGTCGCVEAYVPPACEDAPCNCEEVTQSPAFTIPPVEGDFEDYAGTYDLPNDSECTWIGTNSEGVEAIVEFDTVIPGKWSLFLSGEFGNVVYEGNSECPPTTFTKYSGPAEMPNVISPVVWT